jgi:hypothetical protein
VPRSDTLRWIGRCRWRTRQRLGKHGSGWSALIRPHNRFAIAVYLNRFAPYLKRYVSVKASTFQLVELGVVRWPSRRLAHSNYPTRSLAASHLEPLLFRRAEDLGRERLKIFNR